MKIRLICLFTGLGMVAYVQAQTPSPTVANAGSGNQPASTPAKAALTVPWPPPGTSTNGFAFGGGSLRDFIQAVREVYGVNLLEQATVPSEYLSIKVPKIKLDHVRKQSVLSRLRSLLGIQSETTENEAVEEERLYECLERAMAQLETTDLTLLNSAYQDRRTQSEIALDQAKTPKAIERRLSRIRQKLRVLLRKELENE